jgi:hypothetical protein
MSFQAVPCLVVTMTLLQALCSVCTHAPEVLPAGMDVEAGVDVHPPLNSAEDLAAWDRFLQDLRKTFRNDPDFHEKDGIIRFKAGEGPALVCDGRYFRRFTGKIGLHFVRRNADQIIETVEQLLLRQLPPDRVHSWVEDYGPYDWEDVIAAEDEWEQKYRRAGPGCPTSRVLCGLYSSR